MSHLPLDARAILHYLNELGYRNISATQLKEFLKDLRKLIKYEERMGVNTQQNDYYENLFRRTTASYRAKIDGKNDKRSSEKRKSFDTDKPSSSKQTNGKVLSERNHRETSTSSNDLLNSLSAKSPAEKNVKETNTEADSLKLLIEKTLEQILHDKYCQEFVDKNHNLSKEKSPIKSIVEEVLKEKISDLRHSTRERVNSSGSGSLRSIIEDTVTKVLYDKFSNLQKEKTKSDDPGNGVQNLNQDLQQKLKLSEKQIISPPREPVAQYNNTNKSFDSQSLVQQLLSSEEADNKKGKSKTPTKSRSDKENSTVPSNDGRIKRLQRSPRKKPEWKDPSLHDKIMDKPPKVIRSQSPVASSGGRSGRSKGSSSVLIRRPRSQGRNRKPKSDPVALYQYYKNEWENFRKQIPGESPHSSLRWQVRQRLLDFD